jgi:hypothetical protein
LNGQFFLKTADPSFECDRPGGWPLELAPDPGTAKNPVAEFVG